MGDEGPSSERRLGAIMFTDIVGYSSISERDEKTALRLLEEHRGILEQIFPKYGGVVVKTIGDAYLVEFASAVQAVECGLETQREMMKFNATRPKTESVTIRVGIHVGDVVHSGGDILGDAVNVAARVEPLAEPGGICVTRQVVDQVRGKVTCQLVSMGTRELKNIKNTVEIYRVVPQQLSSLENTTLDRKRVAVIPLTNMSPDPNDGFFADGLTEELISTISKIGGLRVISRTSVMKYKGTTLSMGQIGQELAAGSILEGSVRKAGNRVRITAQLIEADKDEHVWSQSYERDLNDIFAIQGDIAEQIAQALRVQLLEKEKRSIEKKPTDNPEAYTFYLKGRFYWNERTEPSVRKSIEYFEKATKLDPQFAPAYSGLADAYLIMADYGWMDPAEVEKFARRYASRALEIDDSLAEAHASLGLVLSSHTWEFTAAEREFKKAIELRPNYPAAYHWYAIVQSYLNRFEDAKETLVQAISLDPYSRVLNMALGANLFYMKRYDEAIVQLDRVIESNPDFGAVYFWKSLVLAEQARFEEAIAAAKKAVELDQGSSNMKLDLAAIYARSGDRESAARLLNEALSEKRGFLSPVATALVRFGLGESEEAFRLMEKGLEIHDSSLLYVLGSPGFEPFNSDPRWLELQRKAGVQKQ